MDPALKRWATNPEWDAHRREIIFLYISEKRTLSDVMSIMEKDHDFHGTYVVVMIFIHAAALYCRMYVNRKILKRIQMYKKRLKKWGLRKNRRGLNPSNAPSQMPGRLGAQNIETLINSMSPRHLKPPDVIQIP
jgi:hypothetical protein